MIEIKSQSQNLPIRDAEDNQTIEEIRCRFCQSKNKPLITLCQCEGTGRYMHTDCATSLIGKTIEQTQRLIVPQCQFCKRLFSARLLMKPKTFNFSILLRNIKQLKITQIMQSIIFPLGTLVTIWLLILTFLRQSCIFLNYLGANFEIESGYELNMYGMFKFIMFPLTFLKLSSRHYKKLGQIFQMSKILIIELTLHPTSLLSQ